MKTKSKPVIDVPEIPAVKTQADYYKEAWNIALNMVDKPEAKKALMDKLKELEANPALNDKAVDEFTRLVITIGEKNFDHAQKALDTKAVKPDLK